MEPHTGPFTLTHTPAGCPLTHTPPSPLTSTFPSPHPLHPAAPPPSLTKCTDSLTANHVPPTPLTAPGSLCQCDCLQLWKEYAGRCSGRDGRLSATELYVYAVFLQL